MNAEPPSEANRPATDVRVKIVYNEARDFAFVTDSGIGVHTFEISGKAVHCENGGGWDGYYDFEGILE